MRRGDDHPVRWRVFDGLSDYDRTIEAMERTAAAVADGQADEQVWLVEHPPLYTAGTRARDADLIDARFPVHVTGRGGEFTYHGPGQRVAYPILDLNRRTRDLRAYVAALEEWIIATLSRMNIRGERRADRVGVWVQRPDRPALDSVGRVAEDKIAAIGVRARRWIVFHGISVNVDPDLSHYSGIVPCGIAEHGVTSLVDLGHVVAMEEFDGMLRSAFESVFGPTAYVASNDMMR